MASHSNTLAWRIPWKQELGGLLSVGLQRIRHHLATIQKQQEKNHPLSGKIPAVDQRLVPVENACPALPWPRSLGTICLIMEQGLSGRGARPPHPSEFFEVIPQQGAKMLQLLFF